MFFPLHCWIEICLLLLCSGCQPQEPTVMGLKEAVKSNNIVTAAFGGEANLYCNFSLSVDILQVTWQKRNESVFQNIATYSPNHGLRLIGSFQKKARFTSATLKTSAITLQNLTFEDESYYRCIFNVFPHGSFSKEMCLNIQTISEITVEYDSHKPTEDLLTAVCSATGKPAPKITWLDDRDLKQSSEIHHIQNANGTVTVENRLTFPADHLHALTCLLDHPQGRKVKTVYLEKGKKDVPKSKTITVVLLAVAFLILISCVMRLINRERKKCKRCRAPRTPAKEKGLHQDLDEKAMNLHTPRDLHVVYQNEERLPGSSLHKYLPDLKKNLREKKVSRCLFSKEAENLNSNDHSMFEKGPVGLRVKEIGCTPVKEKREVMASGPVQITPHPGCCPAQDGKI